MSKNLPGVLNASLFKDVFLPTDLIRGIYTLFAKLALDGALWFRSDAFMAPEVFESEDSLAL